MPFTHNYGLSWNQSGANPLTPATVAATGNAELNLDITLPASGCTNLAVDVAFPFAGINALLLSSDRAVTIKTNNSGAPDNTLAVPANTFQAWFPNGIFANPFTTDVTQYYLTAGSGAAAGTLYHRLVGNF